MQWICTALQCVLSVSRACNPDKGYQISAQDLRAGVQPNLRSPGEGAQAPLERLDV